MVDPDEETVAGKVALSTCIWICDEEGALVLNAGSLVSRRISAHWSQLFSLSLSRLFLVSLSFSLSLVEINRK